MADATVGDVYTDARALLNDNNAIQFTDAVLLPYVKIAWDELSTVLAALNIPVLREVTADINVDSSTVELVPPTDLVSPIKLQEKPQGSTDEYYADMRQGWWEGSEFPAGAYINFWAWREQKFYFAPHTSNQSVRIFYIKDLSVIADANSIIAVNHCKVVLAKRTAALVARYVGANPTRADSLDVETQFFMNQIMALEVRTTQSMPMRRRSFSRRRSF